MTETTKPSPAATYIKPIEVTAPRDMWQLTQVLYDGGQNNGAVALGTWDNQPVIAIRNNGNSERPKGNPVLSVHPTWFIVPSMLNMPILVGVAIDLCRQRPEQLSHIATQFEPALKNLYGTRYNAVLSLLRRPLLQRVITLTRHKLLPSK